MGAEESKPKKAPISETDYKIQLLEIKLHFEKYVNRTEN